MLRDERLDMLERRTASLTQRLERLEREVGCATPLRRTAPSVVEERRPAHTVRQPRPRPPVKVRPPRPAQPPRKPREPVNVEDLLGGRVLAWVGGIAVFVGIAFFFALAISHGWIGPAARTIIAGAGALALLGAGIWLHDRKGRTDAALAAVSTALAGLFATVTVASQVYHLFPPVVGLVLAACVGACATWLAVRWEAKGIAALGIGGSLLAPVLVGAPSSTSSMAFLLIASAAAAGVLLWQRWDWLAFGSFAVATPQWIVWLFDAPPVGTALLVMSLFGALNLVAAIGFELRMSSKQLRRSSTFLVPLNALVLAIVGWFVVFAHHHQLAGELWLVALALAHLALGLAERRAQRISHDLGLLSLVLGVALADIAYGVIVSGPALAVGWAAGAVAFALIGRRSKRGSADHVLAQTGLGVHVALVLIRALVADAPPSAVSGGSGGVVPAAVALCALAAACFASGRLAQDGHVGWRIALDSLGLAAFAYLTAIALDGPAVAIAWAAEAGALAQMAHRSKDRVAQVGAGTLLALATLHALFLDAPPSSTIDGVRHLLPVAAVLVTIALAAFRTGRAVDVPGWREGFELFALGSLAYLAAVALDGALLPSAWIAGAVILAEIARRLDYRTAAFGALGLGGLASIHATLIEAPPRALVYGVDHLAGAVAVLVLLGAATLRMAQLGTAGKERRMVLAGSAALTLLYAASVAVVTAFQPDGSGAGLSIFDIGTRQTGQVLLSALWSLAGVAALVVGLRQDIRSVRVAALGLLLVAVGKVFLYDLAALTSVYRVASFVGLGLLLLAAAFAWQRMRPRPLDDLRTVPKAVR